MIAGLAFALLLLAPPDGEPLAPATTPPPAADRTGAMIAGQRAMIGRALPSARRGDDPNGPPGDERLLRTVRRVGGNLVYVPVLSLPLAPR